MQDHPIFSRPWSNAAHALMKHNPWPGVKWNIYLLEERVDLQYIPTVERTGSFLEMSR